jgi:hypothetical protein
MKSNCLVILIDDKISLNRLKRISKNLIVHSFCETNNYFQLNVDSGIVIYVGSDTSLAKPPLGMYGAFRTSGWILKKGGGWGKLHL